MNPRITMVSQINGKRFERECEILFRDHKLLIARPVLDKFNDLFVFYAQKHTNGFNVVMPGESIGVNLCEINIPKASGRYKLAADGSVSIEIDAVNYAETYKVLTKPFERRRPGR